MMKRTLATLSVVIVSLIATASVALADYPPDATVEGKTIRTVAPDSGALAFTGSNTVAWIAAVVVLLVAGAALLKWASSERRSSRETT